MEPSFWLFLSVASVCAVSPNTSDQRHALNEYYKQSGLEQTVKHIEKRYVPQEVKFYIGNVGFVSKVITEKRIVFIWTF